MIPKIKIFANITIKVGIITLMTISGLAQVGIGTTNPDASSGLDINYTDKGFLPPRMTIYQRDAIIAPADGLMIFNTTSGCPNYFYSGSWHEYCGTIGPSFACGTSTVTFTYNGSQVTYGTVMSAGKCWLDRNLGASQVATSSTDALAYGDLFQWGRLDDGHQSRTSNIIYNSSPTDVPAHSKFILTQSISPFDWRIPQNNNLWQGASGINNPCPDGFRLPTLDELDMERLNWSTNNAAGAFASPLKLTLSGGRNPFDSWIDQNGIMGVIWSSNIYDIYSQCLFFDNSGASVDYMFRAGGLPVRCIIDCDVPSIPTSGNNISSETQIEWNWNTVPGASGYKYNSKNNYSSAIDNGTSTNFVQTNLICGSQYTLFVWAYNECGKSIPLTMIHSHTLDSISFLYNGNLVTYGIVVGGNNKCWLDRNLGASRVATITTDVLAYGDLFQWGRLDDGHQVRNSTTTAILSNNDIPGHDSFILSPSIPNDWRAPQNHNLWNGFSGTNNPCPNGFRLPTGSEWDIERNSWSTNDSAGAFDSALKLPVAGYRRYIEGLIYSDGLSGYYWSNSILEPNSQIIYFSATSANIQFNRRGYGFSVRCIMY